LRPIDDGLIYHVINRGNHRQRVFRKPVAPAFSGKNRIKKPAQNNFLASPPASQGQRRALWFGLAMQTRWKGAMGFNIALAAIVGQTLAS
jgi:hypothetical protein